MPKRDIVVVGASAGGVGALQELVHGLPAEYSGTIFVVLHTGPVSFLPELLNRSGKITATSAEDNVRFAPNRIYVAPPNRHLQIQDGIIKLSAGPRENGSRPSIDPLFRSAARSHRARVVGVILTGTLDDGAAGLFAVKARGGVAIVQDPSEAFSPEMPLNAMRNVNPDYCVPLSEIPPLLAELASVEVPPAEKEDVAERPLLHPPGQLKEPPPNETQISLVCQTLTKCSVRFRREFPGGQQLAHRSKSFPKLSFVKLARIDLRVEQRPRLLLRIG